MATSPLLLSPLSSASYDLVSSVSGSLSDRAASDLTSDDEVVWLPHGSVSSYESSLVSDTDDDFVVLSRPRSPLRSTPAEASTSTDSIELSSAISQLSLGQTSAPHRPAVRGIGIERPSSTVTLRKAPLPSKSQPSVLGGGSLSKSQKKARKKAARKAVRPVSSTFPVVDDASSDTGSATSVSTISRYEDAASFITS